MLRITRSFVLVSLVLLATPSSHADVIKRLLAPGIEYSQETTSTQSGPQLINILRINMKAPGVKVKAEIGKDVVLVDDATNGREAVGSLALRHGAIAAVNADYFPYTGDPTSITIRDGEFLSESLPHRVALAITGSSRVQFSNLLTVGSIMGKDGVQYSLDGINRIAGKDEIVLLTSTFGARSRAAATSTTVFVNNVNLPIHVGQDHSGMAGDITPGDSKSTIPDGGAILVGNGTGADWLRAHVHTGEAVTFRFDCLQNTLPTGPYRKELASRAASFRGRSLKSLWTDVQQAVGGGPWLVRDGHVFVDGAEENFPDTSFVQAKHPRTAAGVTAAGDLLLVTVDGRQEGLSKGMSLSELADYMARLGAVNAINLDGGGSTSMVIRGAYVNSPSDGYPRTVASMLAVYYDSPDSGQISTGPDPVTLKAGESSTLAAPIVAEPGDSDTRGVWGSPDGKAFISQRGVLRVTQAGPGFAMWTNGKNAIRVPYIVLPGSPAKVRASLGSVANNPPDRNSLTVSVQDKYGNPIPGQQIQIQVSGGTADMTSVTTDATGRATMEVVWNVDKGRKVIATSGSLTGSAGDK